LIALTRVTYASPEAEHAYYCLVVVVVAVIAGGTERKKAPRNFADHVIVFL
jgi:hypothetical protein